MSIKKIIISLVSHIKKKLRQNLITLILQNIVNEQIIFVGIPYTLHHTLIHILYNSRLFILLFHNY